MECVRAVENTLLRLWFVYHSCFVPNLSVKEILHSEFKTNFDATRALYHPLYSIPSVSLFSYERYAMKKSMVDKILAVKFFVEAGIVLRVAALNSDSFRAGLCMEGMRRIYRS